MSRRPDGITALTPMCSLAGGGQRCFALLEMNQFGCSSSYQQRSLLTANENGTCGYVSRVRTARREDRAQQEDIVSHDRSTHHRKDHGPDRRTTSAKGRASSGAA